MKVYFHLVLTQHCLFDFDIYFSQVKVGLVKGKFEVVEEIRKPGHPPVLQQVHRPQDEVDPLAVLVPGPAQVHRDKDKESWRLIE